MDPFQHTKSKISEARHTAPDSRPMPPPIPQDAIACTTPNELKSKYTLIREIGEGAQGHIYRAKRNSDNKIIAIKQLRIDSVQTWKEYDLFMREAEVLRSIEMPGVAHFYEAMQFLDIPEPRAYIVQELIEGRSLDDLMKSGYRFTLNRIFQMASKLIALLEQLHTHNPPIIHRDIKPSNILIKPTVGDEFEVFLIDFGAVANPQVQSGGSTVAGTYGYMPPEQLMGRPSPASDLYALAATLAYLMGGVDPADMQVTDFRLIIEPHLENIPNCVVSTLRQMLEPNESKRLVDYQRLLEIFNLYASNTFENTTLPASLSHDIDLAIKGVMYFGQRGNLDIWSTLPEMTPREVPQSYAQSPVKSTYDKVSIRETAYKVERDNAMPGIIIVTIWSSLFAGGPLIYFLYTLCTDKFEPKMLLCLIFVAIGTIMFNLFVVSTLKDLKHKYANRVPFYEAIHANKKELYKRLLSAGRKTIATIVDISYEPANMADAEAYYQTIVEYSSTQISTEYSSASTKGSYQAHINKQLAGYYHSMARFKIVYKFNPPDDASENDLLHAVFVNNDPSEKLAVGDPLPILYHIDPNNNAHVASMPYPYPLHEMNSYNDIVATSIQA